MRASVVISTKNRKNELREAIASALKQSVSPEVIVMDDGSADGTYEMVREEFPQVRAYQSEKSLGYVAQRNRGADLAAGDIIFSIDDDALFTSPHTIGQILQEFDSPRIGAMAIPYVEPKKSDAVYQSPPEADSQYVTDAFVGTAHAVRRDVFLGLGGYRDLIVHQGEESDLCIRMLDAGYVVRLGNADPIHHLESPLRDYARMDYYGARNSVIFAFLNVPWPYFPFHLLATTWNVLTWTFELRRLLKRFSAVVAGYSFGLRSIRTRNPVSRQTYRLFRQLRKNGVKPLAAFEESLPPMRFD